MLPCQLRFHGDGHPMGDHQERPRCPKKSDAVPPESPGPWPGACRFCQPLVLPGEPEQNPPRGVADCDGAGKTLRNHLEEKKAAGGGVWRLHRQPL